MDYESKPREVAQYNEMGFQIQRIHNRFLELTSFRRKGNFQMAIWVLDDIEAELWYDAERLDEIEEKTYVNELNGINKEIRENFIKMKWAKLYELLLNKEKLLRKLQNDCGKGFTYKATEDYDWD